MAHREQLIAAAKAEDTYDLLHHIAWTDVIEPALKEQKDRYAKMLVAHLLGTPLPGTLTKEQVAGMCYGLDFISKLFESILAKGKKAVEDMQDVGISLT